MVKKPKKPVTVRMFLDAQISRMHLQGMSAREIAAELNSQGGEKISEQLVYASIQKLKTSLQRASGMDATILRNTLLAKWALLEKTYWQEFHLSKADKVKQEEQQKSVISGGGVVPVTETKTSVTKNILGNPLYLQGLERVLKEQAILLNIEPPKHKVEERPLEDLKDAIMKAMDKIGKALPQHGEPLQLPVTLEYDGEIYRDVRGDEVRAFAEADTRGDSEFSDSGAT